MKRYGFLKYVIIGGGVFLTVLATGVVTLHIVFSPSRMKGVAVERMEELLDRKVEIRAVTFTIFPFFGIRTGNITVTNRAGKGLEPEPFVSIGECVVSLRLLPLLRRQLVVDRIVVKNPTVVLESDESGKPGRPDPTSAEKEARGATALKKSGLLPMLPIPFSLERLSIVGGRVVCSDRKMGVELTLGDINQNLAISIDKELENVVTTGVISINIISLQSRGVKWPLSDHTVTLSHNITANVADMNATVNDMRISANDIVASAKGTVQDFGSKTPQIDFAVTTNRVKLSDLAALIPLPYSAQISMVKGWGSMEGKFRLDGEIAPDSAVSFSGIATVENGGARYADFPAEITDLDAKVAFTAQGCSIDTMQFRVHGNPASLSGEVTDFRRPLIDLDLYMQINPEEGADTFPLPGGVAFCGTGDLRCHIATSGETKEKLIDRLGGTLSMTLEDGQILYAPLLRNMAKEVAKYYSIDRMEFDGFELESRVADRRFHFDRPMQMSTRKAGDWQIAGSVGFDATLALSVKNRLAKSVSQSVISTQNRGKDIVMGLLSGTRFAGAASLLDKVGIPVDDSGQITVLLGVEGPVADPRVSFRGFESRSGL